VARRREPGQFVLCLFAVLLLAVCSEGTPNVIDWDFSESHRPADAGWDLSEEERDDPDLDATQIESVTSVRIRLPGGRVFEAGDEVRDIILGREGDLLDELQITFQEQTAEPAYERATALVREWGLDGRNIDEWFAEAKGKTGDEAADIDVSGAFAEVLGPGPEAGRIGPDGPFVSVEIRYSFDDDRPWLVGYELLWPRPEGE
jgi:hypothetical protein